MAYPVLGVVVGYSVISLLNTQILATTERRREFMLQRLIGATRRQVLGMMTVEALMISVAGLLLGLLVAAATLVPLSVSILGSALPGGSPWILVTVIAATFALVLASTLLSTGTFSVRVRPPTPAAETRPSARTADERGRPASPSALDAPQENRPGQTRRRPH